MGFTWVTSVAVGANVNAATINEYKTHIDTLYSTLSLRHPDCVSGAGWTLLPVSANNSLASAPFEHTKLKVDYAFENNCTTVHSAANPTNKLDHHTSQEAHNNVYQGVHDTGYESHDHGYLNGYQFGADTTLKTEDYTGNYTDNQSTHHPGYYIADNAPNNLTTLVGNYSLQYSLAKGTDDFPVVFG